MSNSRLDDTAPGRCGMLAAIPDEPAAASVRVALSVNPALGFTAFTVFLMLDIDLALQHGAVPTHLLAVRLYDVIIGCAIALLGTLAAGARLKRLAA